MQPLFQKIKAQYGEVIRIYQANKLVCSVSSYTLSTVNMIDLIPSQYREYDCYVEVGNKQYSIDDLVDGKLTQFKPGMVISDFYPNHTVIINDVGYTYLISGNYVSVPFDDNWPSYTLSPNTKIYDSITEYFEDKIANAKR